MTKTTWPKEPTGVVASDRTAKGRTKAVPGAKVGVTGPGRRRDAAAALASADPQAIATPAGAMGAAPTPDEPETDSEGRAMVAALMDRMIDEHIAKWDGISARIAEITADARR